jgi:hypothetical protein
MRTLGVAKGMHVYLSGYNGQPLTERWDDLDGTVEEIIADREWIAVRWVFRNGHTDVMRYAAEDFIATTDRNGVPVLVLSLAVGQVG